MCDKQKNRRDLPLSENEDDVIRKIVGFGGYITKDILTLYRKDILPDRCYRILKNLESKGYLIRRDYFEKGGKNDVFQVTKKACALVGRPDAYMRKLHKAPAIRRYLLRSHVLFKIIGFGTQINFFSSADREGYLLHRGYRANELPVKINKDTVTVHIEEYIIDERPYARYDGICLLYIDDNIRTPGAQMKFLLDKYDKMIESRLAYLDFLIITENSDRETAFRRVYKHRQGMGFRVKSMNACYSMIG